MQEVRVMELITSFAREDHGEKYHTFKLMNLDIASVESAALFEFLGHIKNLHILRIRACRMEHFGCRDLAGLLKKDNNITDIDFEMAYGISGDDAEHITDGLKNKNVKSLG